MTSWAWRRDSARVSQVPGKTKGLKVVRKERIGTAAEVERFKAMHPVEVGKDTNGVGDAGVQTVDDVLQLFL